MLTLNYTVLDESNNIIAAGKQTFLATATGILPRVVTDETGT